MKNDDIITVSNSGAPQNDAYQFTQPANVQPANHQSDIPLTQQQQFVQPLPPIGQNATTYAFAIPTSTEEKKNVPALVLAVLTLVFNFPIINLRSIITFIQYEINNTGTKYDIHYIPFLPTFTNGFLSITIVYQAFSIFWFIVSGVLSILSFIVIAKEIRRR